ncbi:MAG: hemolysin family protein [Gammaproteobacteria bacterium]|nr:hemolysin family protein [Gammaproteobacteria bacterium]
MNVTGNLVVVVILLIANGFFVAAEFALVKARGFRIETLANSGSAAAKLTMGIQANLESYLAACQLGITMASLGLGWVGEPAVAALLEPLFHWAGVPDAFLHTTAFIVGFLIFSSLHIVVGEQVPKTFAIRKAEMVSIWIAYPLHLTYLMVYPLNWVLNWASGSLLSLFGVEEATHAEVYSNEEFKGMVATSKEHGTLEHDKATMLKNLFDFDQRHIGRVMLPHNSVDVLDISDDPAENLRKIRETGHSRFPVLDSSTDDIIGLLLTKDLYVALLDGEQEPWKEIRRFCRPPLVVPESQRVSTLFEQMRDMRAHMSFVVDEYGKFVGIITLEDLLEEIVGEIEDETDSSESMVPIIKLEERKWEADGLASLSDIERFIGIDISDEIEANSLSGLIMNQLERMPEAGDFIEIDNFRLTVIEIEDLRVGQVDIKKLAEDEEEQTDS